MADSIPGILELLSQFLEKCGSVQIENIPNIDLYMDQVTTLMDSQLAGTKRHEKDKVLTKTMINNYAKNRILPPPEKKKYSREHIMVLLFIYYLKDFLSFDDIQAILKPVTDRFFRSRDSFDMEWLYRELVRVETEQLSVTRRDLADIQKLCETAYPDAPDADRDTVKTFALISVLSYDVYLKKRMIEELIDRVNK